jgi:pre-rRNA-processing protein TSR3
MSSFLPTIILRHKKENLKKCSLRGLEHREDFLFYTYPSTLPPSLQGYVMLHLGSDTTKELSIQDKEYGLFLLDSTWHYESVMHQTIKNKHPSIIYRSLPKHYITAYPRKQTACLEPQRGLATVEALYIAYTLLQRDTSNLLQHYYWQEAFLEKNAHLFLSMNQSPQK